jgi:ribosomal-protein-alanine N-acetyltransferase
MRQTTPPQIAIRLEPMRPEDLEAVLLIEDQSFTTPWSDALFRSEMKNPSSHLFVARPEGEGDTILGHIGYRVVVDEMHIVIVAVDPAWRRHGIATQMLDQAMAHARRASCTRATLEVRVSNTSAQQLYYGRGFAPVGTRPRYYMRPTEDAFILWRDPL